MTGRCVNTKIYVSGNPVDLSQQSIWMDSENGPVEVTSWKQFPPAQTPVIVSNITAFPPTRDMFARQDLPAGYTHGFSSSSAARGRTGRNSGKILPAFSEFPSDDTTRAALSQVVVRGVAGHGLLISSPPGAGSLAAATLVARELALPESRYTATPGTDRWTVAEIDEKVRRPAYYKPADGTHNVVIIAEADHMAPDAADRLLKTLEEPPSATLFIMSVSNPRKLRPTIRGRLADHIKIGPVPRADRIDRYMEIGMSEQDAARLDDVCRSNVLLADTIAKTSTLETAVTALSVDVRDKDKPVTSARKQSAALTDLAKSLASQLMESYTESPDYDDEAQVAKSVSADRATKATVRVLAHHLVDSTVAALHDEAVHADPVSPDRIEATIRAVSQHAAAANKAIDAYTPVERVLSTFYSRLTAASL